MFHELIIVIVVTCCYIFYYLKKKYSYFKDLGVPCLSPVLILGNLSSIIFRKKHMSQLIQDIYKCDPDAKYVGAYEFLNPIFVIRDPELIKTMLVKNFDCFPEHKRFADPSIDFLLGNNIFNLSGEKWRDARSLLSPLFTSSKLKTMFTLMVECANNFVNLVATEAEVPNNIIDTKDLFARYANDIVASCVYGINLDSGKDRNNDFFVRGSRTTAVDGVFTMKYFLYRSFPRLMKFFNIKYVCDQDVEFFKNVIKKSVESRDEKNCSRPDILQLMMDARGKSFHQLKLDITVMSIHAFGMFFGGHSTTSTHISITAHELAVNPEVQKKLQNEIDRVLQDTDGELTCEAINNMSYMESVLNESMRMYPTGPFLDRMCTKAFELPPTLPGGEPITIKPGTPVWIPMYGIHFDSKYYENPEKFDPDRYLEKKITVNDALNLGFGIGPRSCAGYRFAILEMKILFFYLLSRFTLKPNERTCHPFEYCLKSINVTPKGGFYLSIMPRS